MLGEFVSPWDSFSIFKDFSDGTDGDINKYDLGIMDHG